MKTHVLDQIPDINLIRPPYFRSDYFAQRLVPFCFFSNIWNIIKIEKKKSALRLQRIWLMIYLFRAKANIDCLRCCRIFSRSEWHFENRSPNGNSSMELQIEIYIIYYVQNLKYLFFIICMPSLPFVSQEIIVVSEYICTSFHFIAGQA